MRLCLRGGRDSRVQIKPFCTRRLIHVCKFGLSAPVVLHIELHGCRLWVFAPVVETSCANQALLPPSAFMDVVAELRQGPARLRVLRNSPRAMPLSGLPIMVMFARNTSREQGKLQRACACGCPKIHGGESRVSAPRRLIHVCRSGSFAPVVVSSYADPAILFTRALN